MSVEKNKATLRRFSEEILDKGNVAILSELIATDFVLHTTPLVQEIKGLEGYRQFVIGTRAVFPDLKSRIDKMVAEGDMVAGRFTVTGTHKGELMGIAPTGKKFTTKNAVFARFEGSKIVEVWEYYDSLPYYRQLGIPIPSQ
jgi:steroid delta-isomerase-like uncharacterized protein